MEIIRLFSNIIFAKTGWDNLYLPIVSSLPSLMTQTSKRDWGWPSRVYDNPNLHSSSAMPMTGGHSPNWGISSPLMTFNWQTDESSFFPRWFVGVLNSIFKSVNWMALSDISWHPFSRITLLAWAVLLSFSRHFFQLFAENCWDLGQIFCFLICVFYFWSLFKNNVDMRL